jgi:hypothetical protein
VCPCVGNATHKVRELLSGTSSTIPSRGLADAATWTDDVAQVTYITAPVYQLCNGFTKLSLLVVYLQLSPQKWFRVGAWFSIVVVTLYTSIITVLMFFHCRPVRRAFDFTIETGSCLDAGVLYMATAVSNIITDIMLFVLPTPMVLKLKMAGSRKIAAIAIFGIGSL